MLLPKPAFRLRNSIRPAQSSPVLNIEILDVTELARVVGNEREFQGAGVRRDKEIVRADHHARALSAARIWA
jgi:hypothetical protein